MLKIDIFPHIYPRAFYDRMMAVSDRAANMQKRVREIPVIVDLDLRFRLMDQFPDYRQVLTLASPPLESYADANLSPELARIANDGMCELVQKYPDRFLGFVASLPMNNPPASLQEIDRAVVKLGAKGVQIFSNVDGRPLDDPEFRPILDRMAALDTPIWLHPARQSSFSDYASEKKSRYEMWWVFGWPYETSVAMGRLVFSGIFDRHPNIKIIVHHTGAMVPYFQGRVGPGLDQLGARTPGNERELVEHSLKKRPFDYFRMFYGDTALFGAVAPLECGLDFFGSDRILFGTDMPFDPEKGLGFIRDTIRAVDAMEISSITRTKIYEENARRLLKLP